MITITRSLVRQLRSVFRRAGFGRRLGAGPGSGQPVRFVADATGLRIQCRSLAAAVEYHQSGEFSAESFAVPFEALADCAGVRDDAVTLSLQPDHQIEIGWTDRGLPQSKRFADCADDVRGAWPTTPESWTAAESRAVAALRDAMQTAARDRGRYAIDCVQLRGSTGQIVATDACQLLMQEGFSWPWSGDVLIPRTRILEAPELTNPSTIDIANCDFHVALRIGPWTVWLAIDNDAPYPSVEHVIPALDGATTRFRITADEAPRLAEALDRLPAVDEDSSPVTVDCNGQLVIRAKSTDQPRTTELVLPRAEVTGSPLRFNTNRRFLQRAITLGFHEVHITDAAKPLLCQDDRRKYVWQTLTPEDALPPTEDCLRIELPTPPAAAQNRSGSKGHSTGNKQLATRNQTASNRTTPVVPSRRNRHVRPSASQPTDPETEVRSVRASLRQALVDTRRLLAALRHERRQNRVVRSTLASLRQLQAKAS